MKKIRTFRENREKSLKNFTLHLLSTPEYDDEEYSRIRREADGYEIYIVNEWGYDHNYKGSYSRVEYEARPLRDDEIVVCDGKFVGAVYIDLDGNGKKLCKGRANVAFASDIDRLEGADLDEEAASHGITRCAFIAYRGECCGAGLITDWSFDSVYLRKKEG